MDNRGEFRIRSLKKRVQDRLQQMEGYRLAKGAPFSAIAAIASGTGSLQEPAFRLTLLPPIKFGSSGRHTPGHLNPGPSDPLDMRVARLLSLSAIRNSAVIQRRAEFGL